MNLKKLMILMCMLLVFNVVIISAFLYENHKEEKRKIEDSVANYSLVLHVPFSNISDLERGSNVLDDHSREENDGMVRGKESFVENEEKFIFDGVDDQVIFNDSDELSPAYNNSFTVSFWIKFDDTEFSPEGKNYIHFLGKARTGNAEFVFRVYNKSNLENKNERISFYVYNLNGGIGVGSYVQEPIKKGEYIFITGVYTGTHVQMWKNGVLKDSDYLIDDGIVPQNGRAPLTVGTLDEKNYLEGEIYDLRVYSRALTKDEINFLFQKKPSK